MRISILKVIGYILIFLGIISLIITSILAIGYQSQIKSFLNLALSFVPALHITVAGIFLVNSSKRGWQIFSSILALATIYYFI